jgi:hypothetical protein
MDHAAADPLLVACLCAQWCGVCRQWRTDFAELAARLPQARMLWVDVEDDADALDGFEPESFPVLAVQRGIHLLYCAALPPQTGNWVRVIEEFCASAGAPAAACPRNASLGSTLDLRRVLR